MIALRHIDYDYIEKIFEKLRSMKTELERLMSDTSATEKEKDDYLDKCLKETEKLNGIHANYRIWYSNFCDIRDGFDPDRFLYED